jgi:hypothetical protein
VVVGFHSSYAFLENNLVYTMLNPLGKKRIRVYTMPNSLLRETNSLRSIHCSVVTCFPKSFGGPPSLLFFVSLPHAILSLIYLPF